MPDIRNKISLKSGYIWVWTLTLVLLVLSGVIYRVLRDYNQAHANSPINLPVPLSQFPMVVGDWTGRDIPIPENIQRVAKNDDYLSRLYINKSNKWVNLYVPYTARPRTMLGHRPQECYPANGWIHDSTEHNVLTSKGGLRIPSLIHRFHKPGPNYEEIVIVNFYIVNGHITDDESVFSGIGWRTPNLEGNIARYVTQVQFSSLLKHTSQMAAEDFTDLLLEYFPDPNGIVRIAQINKPNTGISP